MDIQAHFNDIRTVIAVDLDRAQRSIDAAVAWLTDPALFEALLRAARRGCRVRLALLDDAINRQSGLNLERLRAAGGEVFWIPGAQGGQGSLHHKFRVIDGDGVMTGSYTDDDRAAHTHAREDYADYQQSREDVERMPEAPWLDPDQQAELKRLFREASMQCHPDRLTDADKAQAGALFIQVRAAYQQGDLETLRRLHGQLKSSRPFADPATVLTEGDQLRKRVAQLRLEVERLLAGGQALRQHETYRTLAGIADWERYFAEARQRLAEEIERLRSQLKDDHDDSSGAGSGFQR